MRLRLEVLQLLPRRGDLLFEGGDVADLGQSVVEEFFGAGSLLLGSLLGASVLVALPFEFGQRKGGELRRPHRVDAAVDLIQLAGGNRVELFDSGADLLGGPAPLTTCDEIARRT